MKIKTLLPILLVYINSKTTSEKNFTFTMTTEMAKELAKCLCDITEWVEKVEAESVLNG